MVTVIINNRDLLTWPRVMAETISGWQGLHEIIILDNGSTYGPLLDWYETLENKIRVIYLSNLGQAAAWKSDILEHIGTDFYVVTDPDLDVSGVPKDCLLYLRGLLEKSPSYRKIGLALHVDGIPPESVYFRHVNTYERGLRALPKDENGVVSAPVDTTFAIYDRRRVREYFVGGVRTDEPYIAKHIPWYLVRYNREFTYYLDRADRRASSLKMATNYSGVRSVKRLYNEHSGKVSTKWESYLSVYDEIFLPFRDEAVRLLEIGVQNGGSLEIWSRYFSRATTLVGCDINPKCANLKYEDSRINVVVGNANEKGTADQIASCSSSFDIIIDDGSHLSADVIKSFLSYFPRLALGGLYVIEDTHCAYWEGFGGGITNKMSSAHFVKALVDSVNADHFSNNLKAGSLFHSFAPADFMEMFLAENPILSVTAYDSLFVIRKASNDRPRGLGKEVIVGHDCSVEDAVLRNRK